jgi:hypothetical protein
MDRISILLGSFFPSEQRLKPYECFEDPDSIAVEDHYWQVRLPMSLEMVKLINYLGTLIPDTSYGAVPATFVLQTDLFLLTFV